MYIIMILDTAEFDKNADVVSSAGNQYICVYPSGKSIYSLLSYAHIWILCCLQGRHACMHVMYNYMLCACVCVCHQKHDCLLLLDNCHKIAYVLSISMPTKLGKSCGV